MNYRLNIQSKKIKEIEERAFSISQELGLIPESIKRDL
ncbi:hypothetical protein LCGC14_1502770 [marine sediment metagenome]|uniref:Uncharacterized protein n=1 Tax=marine sediment metagenome TaxID=412755 RepID=A0A0F9M532_9ZZZZ